MKRLLVISILVAGCAQPSTSPQTEQSERRLSATGPTDPNVYFAQCGFWPEQCVPSGPGRPDCDQDCDGVLTYDWDTTIADNCPYHYNPTQQDSDAFVGFYGPYEDGGDVCDVCPFDNSDDADRDRVCEDVDTCPGIFNPDQSDSDADGFGDACDQFNGELCSCE